MKKILSIIILSLSCFLLTVSVYAADPLYDSTIQGSAEISQSTCEMFLLSYDTSLSQDSLNIDYLWCIYEERNVITCTLRDSEYGFGYQFWYDSAGKLTCDQFDGLFVTRIAGDPVPIVPATLEAPSDGDLGEIISDVKTGVVGVFDMSKSGFDFITKNDLCMLMVSISLSGVGVALVSRAFRTSRK